MCLAVTNLNICNDRKGWNTEILSKLGCIYGARSCINDSYQWPFFRTQEHLEIQPVYRERVEGTTGTYVVNKAETRRDWMTCWLRKSGEDLMTFISSETSRKYGLCIMFPSILWLQLKSNALKLKKKSKSLASLLYYTWMLI